MFILIPGGRNNNDNHDQMLNTYNLHEFFIRNFQNIYQTIYTCSIHISNLRFKWKRL